MHWAEVRVPQAINDVQNTRGRSSASARRNHRNIQGDSRLQRASAEEAARAGSACMNEHVGLVADELQAGSDTLQAATKPATLRCYRLDPI